MQKRALVSENSAAAEAAIRRIEQEESANLRLIQGGPSVATPPLVSISLPELKSYGEDWVNDALSLRQSPSTITGKKETLQRLFWFLNKIGATRFGPRELQRFTSYITLGHEDPEGRWGNPSLVNPASDRTVAYYFNYARAFCRWMMRDPYVPINVDLSYGVRIVKPKKETIQPFSEEHIGALLMAAKRGTNPLRDEAILLFMLDTGVRASEICSLRWGDVEMHAGYGQAKVLGKGRKERIVPFSRLAARMLWKYSQDSPRAPQSPVFMSERGKNGQGSFMTRSGLLQLFNRLEAASGIKGVRCSPHTMRHTFAINFLRAGGNTFTLQAILGHEDLKMTQKYCAIAQADIQSQHRQFSPGDRARG